MTPFGRFMRGIRLDRAMLLKECADKLEVTAAYLSALEHGKKGLPSVKMVEKIIAVFNFDSADIQKLRQAIRDSERNIEIPQKMTPFAFETANAFARELPSLTKEQLQQIQNILRSK